MKMKIRIGINIFLRIVLILLIMLIIDIASVYIINKPIFAIKKEHVYKGNFFDVYDCGEFSTLQIKLKNEKYSCSDVDFGFYRLTVDENKTCDEKLNLYLDGERKIYLSCVDEVFVEGDYAVFKSLSEFIGRDINKLNKILDNYEGQPYKDGGSISYTIRYRGEIFRVDRCNSLSGNHNIYIGNKKMKFMCSREGD